MTVEALNFRKGSAFELLEPIRRFPFPAFFIIALTALNWRCFDRWVHGVYRIEGSELQHASLYLSPFLIAAFFMSFALALYSEASGRKLSVYIASLGGLLVLAAIYPVGAGLSILLPHGNAGITWEDSVYEIWSGAFRPSGLSRAFLLAALALLPLVAPYAARKEQTPAFWQFNHKLGVALAAALFGAGLSIAGFAAIVETIKLLFGLEFPDLIYAKAWVLALFLASPLIWLALTPRDFEELPRTGEAKEFTSKAVALLVKFILIPVASALSLILAAYVALVIVQGSFDTARLGFRSLIYGIGIILVALLAFPDREESAIVRIFWRVWPWLLIAPSILFFPALWTRIAEYGWTPFRYLALVGGLWMALAAALSLSRRLRQDLRILPGLLAAVLALAAFGPWGVSQVTGRSQAGRLEALATEHKLLVNGKWQAEAPAVSWTSSEHQAVRGAVDSLALAGQLYRLQPWFEGQNDNPFANSGGDIASKLRSRLNLPAYYVAIDVARRPPPLKTVSFSSPTPAVLKAPSESYVLGPIQAWHYGIRAESLSLPEDTVEIKLGENDVEVLRSGKRASFNLKDFLLNVKQSQQANGETTLRENAARLLSGEGDLDAKLAIVSLSGNPDGKNVFSGQFYVILPAAQR